MYVGRKNQRHRTEIESKSTKVGNGTKNAAKILCLKKKGEKKMMKSWRAADRKNAKEEKSPAKGKAREKKAQRSIKIAKNRGHQDRLDVSYSSRAASLDRARNNEMAQQGGPMCDTNAMMQAQQQQLPYLPPNYPGLPM
uniref:Uncharacterized protein n=1 Tax=Romanomermis culicivorax TaxID=13658 RepID=A0A915IV35_ROMCU